MEFRVDAGRAFHRRHREARFDVLECGEFLAEGVVARHLVADVATVVRIHSPSIILDRYLDFAPRLSERIKKVYFQITSDLGAWRRGLPLRPLLLEPFAFTWVPSRDVEERNFTASADAVLVMNEEMRCFAIRHWWIKPEGIHLVPNPYLPERQEAGSVAAARSGGKTIGFIGRLEPRKGLVELAKALVEVLPNFPDWRVRIAGQSTPSCVSGSDAGKIAREILKNFEGQVVFEGRIEPDRVQDWLDGIDVCVFPGLWESFSYVTLEAAEAGKAIIGTETGAVAEILDGGRAGLIVEPGNERGLAKALGKLMADGELRSVLGDAAKRRFEERFHPDRVMGEILEVYREAVLRAEARR
jgi:glycosyltransferase involved in cell wall biosynthesis